MADIRYLCILVIYMSRPCVVGFALCNVRNIFHRKMVLVVFNISVACHNFKTTVRNHSVTRQMLSISIFVSLILLVLSKALVEGACLS